MTGVAASLAFGAVFGLALAAPPGPMNAVIAEESVLRGWLAGVTAGLGAMTADLCFLVLSLMGVVTVVDSVPRLRAIMLGVGGLLMLGFAAQAIRDARTETAYGDDIGGRGFLKAFALAITNPYQILFWLTVGVGLLEPGTVDVLGPVPIVGDELAGAVVVRTGSPALIVGLFVGIGVWIVGFPASLVAVGRRTDRFAHAIATVSALILVAFGLLFLGQAANGLL